MIFTTKELFWPRLKSEYRLDPEGNAIWNSLRLSRSPMKMLPLRARTIRSDLRKVSHILRHYERKLASKHLCSMFSVIFLLAKQNFFLMIKTEHCT